MRFFKHGDSLAIVLPEALRKASGVNDSSDYEFHQAEPGVFILASREKIGEILRQRALAPVPSAAVSMPSKPLPPQPPQDAVLNHGFAIIEGEEEAKFVSQKLEKQVKTGQVLGVRGFDKRFYLVSSEFMAANAPRVMALLASKDMPISDIVAATRLDEKAATALLAVMKDQGEVIEKKHGVYKSVG
ncbi:MAG: hypothetical protein V1708_03840 [Candidatus Micrarchaeota archaeon]